MRPTNVLLETVERRAGVDCVAGIDVSYHQGVVNWETVADVECHYSPKAPFEDFKFAIVRTGDGAFRDPQFANNWKGAKRVGLIRGCYHYLRAGIGIGPVGQANIVLDMVDAAGGIDRMDLPPCIDVENLNGRDSAELHDAIGEFRDRIVTQLHVSPILYTYPSFWCANLMWDYEDLALWIAHYRGDNLPGAPAKTKPPLVPTEQWPTWLMWQHSATGRIDGVKPGTDVDLNIFNGSEVELRRFIALCWENKLWQNYAFPPKGRETVLTASDGSDAPASGSDYPIVVVETVDEDPSPVVTDSDPVAGNTVPVVRPPDAPELAQRPGCLAALAALLGGKR
jgi:lysozyme